MPIIDTIIVVILAGFVFYGLFFGLIRAMGTFLGVIIGALLASHFYLMVFEWLEGFFFGYNNLGKVAVFLILFSIIYRLVGLGFYMLDRVFNIISIIPFLKTFNRLGGALLGFATGSLFIGFIIYVVSRYSFIEHWTGKWLVESQFAPILVKVTSILTPLFPEVLKKLQSLI